MYNFEGYMAVFGLLRVHLSKLTRYSFKYSQIFRKIQNIMRKQIFRRILMFGNFQLPNIRICPKQKILFRFNTEFY